MNRFVTGSLYFLSLICVLTVTLTGCDGSGGSSGGGGASSDFAGPMTSIQVVPPVPSTSSGSFTATIAPDQTYVDITIIHDVQNVTGVHLHGPAAVGENGPAIFDILANGTVTPIRSLESERGISQVLIEARFVEVSQSDLDDLNSDNWYVQIHSSMYPAGELRGQLLTMPTLIMPPFQDEIDVEGASLTYIEGLNLNQVRLNEASIRLFNNTDDLFDVFSFFGPNLSQFDFFGDGIDVSAPNGLGVRTLQTMIHPHNPCIINVDLNVVPTISSDNSIDLSLLPRLGEITSIESNVKLSHRPATILGGLLDTTNELGGMPAVDNAIPGLGSIPFIGRLFSTGSKSSLATKQTLLVFVTAHVIDSEEPRGFIDPFPCGLITDGIVICPEDQGAVNNGDRIVVSMGLDDTIPVADGVNSYQYGFVFDSDGNAANNFVPDPAFPQDFFQGTDKWYFLNYNPTDGWVFYAVDASGAGNPVRVLTDAKIIIKENSITLTVPQDEFVLANPSYRATAFRYTGALGSDEDFELSYHPGIGETLEPIVLP